MSTRDTESPENSSQAGASGSRAVSRPDGTSTGHIPLVSGTEEESAERAGSGLTLGERLATEAREIREGSEPEAATGFVGTAPMRQNPSDPVYSQQHVGSNPALASNPEDQPGARPAHVNTGAVAAGSAGIAAAEGPQEFDEQPSAGLAGVGASGTRPEADFLHGFDDDEVGDYVPGQWDEAPADSGTETAAMTTVSSQVRDVESGEEKDTRSIPVAAAGAGLAGAAALGARKDEQERLRRQDEDTPFLRRQREEENAAFQERERAATKAQEYTNRMDLLDRERAAFGGLRLGTGFFGWLTAMGMVGLLSLIASAVVGIFSYWNNTTGAEATRQIKAVTTGDALTGGQGLVSAVVAGLIIFIAFVAGGYVAGRMARFSGVAQGFGVWLWFAAVSGTSVVAAIFGLKSLSGTSMSSWLPNPDQLTSLPAIVTLVAIAVLALCASLIGGGLGMRYHRRIDRADFEEELVEEWED